MEESYEHQEIKKEPKKRLLSIDVFKGLTILLMVYVNSIALFYNTPAWSKHALDYGLTYVDLIAPFFIFMMALNYKPSYERRLQEMGRKKTYYHFLQRYLIFLGLGLALTLGMDYSGIYLRWGTLQYLGVSGLILLLLIELKPSIRIIFAAAGMIFHQVLLEVGYGDAIYDAIEGGVIGVFSWTSMLILSSVLAEGLHNGKIKEYFVFGGIICIILGIITNFIWGISRQRISLPFILLSIGIASLFFYFLYQIFDVWGKNHAFTQKENFLSITGKNAFILFIFHIFSISIIYTAFPLDSEFVLVFIIAVINVVIIGVIGYLMYKADIIIVL